MKGLELLGIEPVNSRKQLMVIAETDGCFVDGIEVTAQVSAGHRTLKINDYGRIAATFVHLKTGQAIRLSPKPGIRELAKIYIPAESRAYFAQLRGYQVIPDEELLSGEQVVLNRDLKEILGSPSQRALCSQCGEEIINGRELGGNGKSICLACTGQAYYSSAQRERS